MLRAKSMVYAAAFTAAILVSGYAVAQDCGGCAQGGVVSQGCSSCSVGSGVFGYPATEGCTRGGLGQCKDGCSCGQHLKEKWQHTKEIAAKVCERNAAWPKPFNCADRQVYFSIWEPMIASGFEVEQTLTDAHFDGDELNKYGQARIASIMNNMPAAQRRVFVHRGWDQDTSDTRLASVKDVLNTWYARSNVEVAFSDRLPRTGNGSHIENINRLYFEGTQPPIIPVASGTGGTSDVGQ